MRNLGIPMWFGIPFFFLAASCPGQLQLAAELFDEGNWPAARREALRELTRSPGNPDARLWAGVAALRQAEDVPAATRSLEVLADSAAPAGVRTRAAYEAGRARWEQGDMTAAYGSLKKAFVAAESDDMFLKSSCSLDLLVTQHPNLARQDIALLLEIRTVEPLWTDALRRECAPARRHSPGGFLARPGQWIVLFYRKIVAPAIGQRCSLSPSCSEYFRQASVKHGLLAFPIAADRLVREPSVVAQAEKPLRQENGSLRFADPVSAHDFWLQGAKP